MKKSIASSTVNLQISIKLKPSILYLFRLLSKPVPLQSLHSIFIWLCACDPKVRIPVPLQLRQAPSAPAKFEKKFIFFLNSFAYIDIIFKEMSNNVDTVDLIFPLIGF